MFKINKGSLKDRYNISCYMYIREVNFYTFLYSIENATAEQVAYVLQGRIVGDNEDIGWAIDIARLTNCDAVIGEDGILRAVPLKLHQKENINERQRKRVFQK